MKEISNIKPVYLGKYDVHVNPYLTYAEIQAIITSVKKFDTWAERNINTDVLLLHFATDITDEEIEKAGHDVLLKSGLIDAVKECVINLSDIYSAVEFDESPLRLLTRISKELPEFKNKLDEVMTDASGKKQ